jgi:ATP-dependent DNA ligase
VVLERGYEGLVVKDTMAPYRPTTRWWKVKVRREGRFLIGGMSSRRVATVASCSAHVLAGSCGT